jgi:hypothetical protein
MPHPFHLVVLAVLAALTALALASLAVDAGDELTERQAHVLCAALKTIEHVAIAYGTALAAQDTPLTLLLKAVISLLR